MATGFGINYNPWAAKQTGITNQAAGTAGGQAGQLFGLAEPAINQEINPNAQTTAALTQLPVQAANAAFASGAQNNAERVARTGNSAGFTAGNDALALRKAQADATAALQGQNAVQGLRNQGIENAGKFYGIADPTMANLYGTAGRTALGSGGINASFGIK